MCGISGFIDLKNRSSEIILEKMSHSLSHRGPDGSGLQFFQRNNFQVGLGHQRLSIIDLSDSGKQPMRFGNLCITFNGEIYNYKEIKNELIELHHKFNSHSDTEVILHAYIQWGIKCVDKFIGMFAFVIYDTLKEEIICVRDRAGVKPFYYYWQDGLFLFASELKAFHQHPHFKKQINLSSLTSYMQCGNIAAPQSIFMFCNKLLPGNYLLFQINNLELNQQKYWDVYSSYNQPKLDISFNEAKIETEKILSSAAEYRMVSDVPVGIFLSGGYDSACLTALLQKNRKEKLKTFTIAVKDEKLNEAPFAKIISEKLGTDHSEYYCTEKEALDLIPLLPYYYDEPFADQSAIATMLVSKMAKKYVSVALSADGGDEVFAGYNRYDYLMKYGRILNQLPVTLRKSLFNVLKHVEPEKVPIFKNHYNFNTRYKKLLSLLNDPSVGNIINKLNTQFSSKELEELFIHQPNLHVVVEKKDLHSEFLTPLSYMMASDYQDYLSNDILQKVDRASMSQGLEAREPFLDHRIIEFAARLPDSYKYHRHTKKYILKEIVYQYLPKELMHRPKMGFAVPVASWLSKDLMDLVSTYLQPATLQTQGIFNVQSIITLQKEFFSGKKEHAQKLWFLLMFQMWYKKWME